MHVDGIGKQRTYRGSSGDMGDTPDQGVAGDHARPNVAGGLHDGLEVGPSQELLGDKKVTGHQQQHARALGADRVQDLLARTKGLHHQAGEDRVVLTASAEKLALRLRSASALVLPGSRHEILMEKDEVRALFWAAFDAFVPGEDIQSANRSD
jgi:hypothetical protein